MRRFRFTLTIPLALAASVLTNPLAATELDPAASSLFGATEIGLPRELATEFGTAVAAGDFNCDGQRDLAIGMPYWNVGTITDAGGVMVQFGPLPPAAPPSPARTQLLDRGGNFQVFAYFGQSLAAGDLDRDGCDDLVVGEPGYLFVRGVVHIFRGAPTGLSRARGFLGSDSGAYFGYAVAILPRANLPPVLAVGEPGYERGDVDLAGRVVMVFTPLATATTSPVDCTVEAIRGRCGLTLAIGLRTGVPVVYAGAPDANTITTILVHPDGSVGTIPLPAPAGEGYVGFGEVFDAVDVNGDGFDSELVVGQPGATVNGRPGAGRLALLRIGSTQLATVWNRHQAELGFSAEAGDAFGSLVRRFDVDGDARQDVVVGAEKEAFGTGPEAGGVLVLRATGGLGGFELASVQFLRPADVGIAERPDLSFGGPTGGVASLPNPLALGDDLVLGVPYAVRDPTFGFEGVVVRVPQSTEGLFRDGFESGDSSAWSHVVP